MLRRGRGRDLPDGKLYTRVKDSRVRRVYEEFVAFGSPESLLVDAHPHVGTNRWIKLVKRMYPLTRCRLRRPLRPRVVIARSERTLRASDSATARRYLRPRRSATGHLPASLYEVLDRHGVSLVRKAFATEPGRAPPSASRRYSIRRLCRSWHGRRLTRWPPARGVTFCMCPGGYVIPTPTSPTPQRQRDVQLESRLAMGHLPGSHWNLTTSA